MTRFDIPLHTANFVTCAMEAGLVDARGLMALAIAHGTNWPALRSEVMEWAHARRCDTEWRKAHHRVLCRFNDEACRQERDAAARAEKVIASLEGLARDDRRAL